MDPPSHGRLMRVGGLSREAGQGAGQAPPMMFALRTIPVAIFVVHAAASGEIWVAHGPPARRVTWRETPINF